MLDAGTPVAAGIDVLRDPAGNDPLAVPDADDVGVAADIDALPREPGAVRAGAASLFEVLPLAGGFEAVTPVDGVAAGDAPPPIAGRELVALVDGEAAPVAAPDDALGPDLIAPVFEPALADGAAPVDALDAELAPDLIPAVFEPVLGDGVAAVDALPPTAGREPVARVEAPDAAPDDALAPALSPAAFESALVDGVAPVEPPPIAGREPVPLVDGVMAAAPVAAPDDAVPAVAGRAPVDDRAVLGAWLGPDVGPAVMSAVVAIGEDVAAAPAPVARDPAVPAADMVAAGAPAAALGAFVEPTPGDVLRGSVLVEGALVVAGAAALADLAFADVAVVDAPALPAAFAAEPTPGDVLRASPDGLAATVATTARDVPVRAGLGTASGSGVGSATDCLTSLAMWSLWTSGVCWPCSHSCSSIASISTTELEVSLSFGGVVIGLPPRRGPRHRPLLPSRSRRCARRPSARGCRRRRGSPSP